MSYTNENYDYNLGGSEVLDFPTTASYEVSIDQCGECENGSCDCLPVVITGTPREGFGEEYTDRGPDSKEVAWSVNGSRVEMGFLALLLGSEWKEVKASIVQQLNPGIPAWMLF
jgi:hypothetical protein